MIDNLINGIFKSIYSCIILYLDINVVDAGHLFDGGYNINLMLS